MNLLLLEDDDLRPDGTARLLGRRALHVAQVLRPAPGDTVQAGMLGGKLGEARVLEVGPEEVVVAPRLDRDPPAAAPISLLLALPRPKILRRVLQAVASMGVKQLVLLGSWRVERSYWSSPALAPDAVREELTLGLEQGRDTVLPTVLTRRLFKPFVEDELDATFAATHRLLADPGRSLPLLGAAPSSPRAALAIGPEGGWTAYERDELERRGFTPFSLGPRVLRVDTAVPFAIGQVALWLEAAARAARR